MSEADLMRKDISHIQSLFFAVLRDEVDWERAKPALRRIGAQWAAGGYALATLLCGVRAMSDDLMDVASDTSPPGGPDSVRTLGKLVTETVIELAAAFQRNGTPAEAGPGDRRSAVIAFRAPSGLLPRVLSAFRRREPKIRQFAGHLLLPAAASQATALCHEVIAELGEELWLAVHWQPGEITAQDRKVTTDVLDIVSALGLPSGVYGVDDIVVEYASVHSPEVATALCELIHPMMGQERLLETLRAIINADGNRALAAKSLNIHRSTIDYRIQRIEELTGQCAYIHTGLGVLSSALVAHQLGRGDN